MASIKETAQKISARCDGYSAERYRSWAAVAEALLKRGLSEFEVEAIMYSKWVRWAADMHGGRRGFVPAKAVIDYLDKNGITAARIKELTVEHFGEAFVRAKPGAKTVDLSVEVRRLKDIIERAQKESELSWHDGQPMLLVPYWFIKAK